MLIETYRLADEVWFEAIPLETADYIHLQMGTSRCRLDYRTPDNSQSADGMLISREAADTIIRYLRYGERTPGVE